MDDPWAAVGQIEWEYRRLHRADVVLFWLPATPGPQPAVQPIALYELGAHAATGKPIAVGCDPGYPRRTDVVLQLGHVRPDVIVRDTLPQVCADVLALLNPGS
jgi:Nucleoside 2-deoxyribosyltransferase like